MKSLDTRRAILSEVKNVVGHAIMACQADSGQILRFAQDDLWFLRTVPEP
jgi:hypothetical protein